MNMDRRIAKAPPPDLAKINTNPWTEPFWAAARRHELVFARCHDCGQFRMPPTPFCPHCRSQAIDWVPSDGRAILYSYTIVERAIMPGMEECLPYVPAIAEFPDTPGVRLITNVVGSELYRIMIGKVALLDWLTLPDGTVLPVFRMAE